MNTELFDTYPEIVGRSATMAHLLEEVTRVAAIDVTVFIGGESGSGKELVARALHRVSRRREGPFLGVNCGAITETLQDSELFGHERGAFTGANKRHLGVFERADHGTVLLDEVGELSPATQVRLLRVVQERGITRVGGDESIPIDIRVISATNKDLRAEVIAGRFREDLFYRLVVYPIWVPPLRDRTEDVPVLANHFLEAAKEIVVTSGITPDAMAVLKKYSWPGNVRELENVVKHVCVKAGGQPIQVAHLPASVREETAASNGDSIPIPKPGPGPTLGVFDDVADVSDSPFTVRLPVEGQPGEMLAHAEKEAILATLLVTSGRVVVAARKLGLSRATLYRKLKKYGIEAQEFREATEKMEGTAADSWPGDGN